MKESLLSSCEPRRYFRWYEALSAIPHGSRSEKAIADFVEAFGRERGYDVYRDELHNVLLTVPATPCYENEPSVLLQAHLDMVCVKDEGGILRAGIGNCLHEASAPASLATDHGRVAYIAQSACYWENDSMRAGYPYWDVPGRPGMNGLRHIEECLVTKEEMAFVKDLAQRTLVNAENDIEASLGYGYLEDDSFSFGTVKFRESDHTGRFSRVNETDMQRTERGIRDAKHSHEYCVVSLHCHQFRGREEHETDYYLEEYAHRCIDARADAVLGTGTHMPKAIEIYKGRPIFYCLGNFMFQSEYARRYTADFVESRGYPLTMSPAEVHARQNSEATHFMQDFPIYYMGIVPRWEMEGDRLTKIELMAVELGFHEPFGLRGFPSPMDAERLREHMEMVCAPYGTKLAFHDGIIEVLL